jgi:oxygen-independent coproporphyrinogen III oxidase
LSALVTFASARPVASLRPGDLPQVVVRGLYVHVPFCFHKCHYCDFYSITRQTPQRMTQFVDRLLSEATQWSTASTGPTLQPRTVFFGGGTPSLLPVEQMQRLIQGLKARIDLSQVNEWTVEVNPSTASAGYCTMLRQSGVDRLSLGAQSFDRAELAVLERHHDPEDVPRSLALARAAGFSRLNIDLIYAIPGQTIQAWARSLDLAIMLSTPHLSCYGLTFEPNTPMAVKQRLGQVRAVEESLELQMLHHTRKQLTAAGRAPYEISNYAVPGEACRHNLLYWTGGSYVGLGPSAASHVEGHRFRNRPHLGEWEQAVDAGQLPVIEAESLPPLRRAGELVMLMLRLSEPIKFDDYAARSGFDARVIFADPIDRLAAAGLLAVDKAGFSLTSRGIDVADSIASEFLAAPGS